MTASAPLPAAGPLHIGIVGCSAEGAALCYRTICAEGAELLGPHAHPELSLHTPSLHRYVEALDRGDREAVAALMLDSAHRLRAAGAQLLICPDNTIHQAFDLVEPRSPLPWLHIARVVADEARQRGFRRVGVLGTQWLVRSEVYPEALAAAGIEAIRPSDAWRDELGARIMDELVPGRVQPGTVERFQRAIDALRERGCDAVVLGCTEIPLLLGDQAEGADLLNPLALLAEAAVRQAIGDAARG